VPWRRVARRTGTDTLRMPVSPIIATIDGRRTRIACSALTTSRPTTA